MTNIKPSNTIVHEPESKSSDTMDEDTFFNRLEKATEASRQDLLRTPIVEKSLSGDVSVADYHAFLQQAYHHVKHTVPLLMACGSKLSEELEWLREAIANYIEEEIGHQEWILNDIEMLGADRSKAASSQPAFPTDLMVSYAYDTIMRKNPVGFFGMVYVLEKTSSTIATAAANQIQSALSLPKNAMSYMISHGSLDVGHMQDFERIVNRLTSAEDQRAVIDMTLAMYVLYANIFKEIPQLASQIEEQSKAA